MPHRKALTRFFALLALFYALMIAPWPGVRAVYADGIRKGLGNFALRIANLDRSFQLHSAKTYGEHMAAAFDASPSDLDPALLDGDFILSCREMGVCLHARDR